MYKLATVSENVNEMYFNTVIARSTTSTGKSHDKLSHIDKLHVQLEEAKRQVAENLIRSRTIEKTILQVQSTDAAIRNLTTREPVGTVHQSTSTSAVIPYKLGSKSIWLDGSILELIEYNLHLPKGYGIYLLSTLNAYSDDDMHQEIMTLTKSVSFQISSEVFCKVSRASSKGKLSWNDSERLFNNVARILCNVVNPDKHLHWTLLVYQLRKKLLLLHLATTYEKASGSGAAALFGRSASSALSVASTRANSADLASSAGSLGEIKRRPRGNQQASMSSSLSLSQSSGFGPKKKKNRNNKGGSADAPMLLSRSLSGAVCLGDLLSERLSQSKAEQEHLSDKILSSLALISQSVALDSKSHRSAVEFSRRMGGRKMEVVLTSMVRRELKESVSRWRRVASLLRAEGVVKHFLKSIGGVRLFYAMQHNLQRKLSQAFAKFVRMKDWLDGMEVLAAVVEVQRFWRGGLGRLRVLNIKRQRATVSIQAVVRGHSSRSKVKEVRRQLRLKQAVRLIEDAWIRLRWARIMQRRRKAQLWEVKSRVIQRVYRGHVARVKSRAMIQERRRLRAAVRIQSLRRRYVATLRVLGMRHVRLTHQSATQIQRIVRGRLGRIVAAVYRLVLKMALRIQYAWWCCKARIERTKRIRIRAAIRIQKVIRGFIGRRRVLEIRRRIAAFQSIQRASILVMERFIYGFRIRRKFLPLLKQFKQRRLKAVVLLQCRLKAIVLGMKARQAVLAMRLALSAVDQAVREKERREELERLLEQKRKIRRRLMVVNIQRVYRGRLGRKRAAIVKRQVVEAVRKAELQSSFTPLYWRLRLEYYKSQNLFHRPYIIKIQCAMRQKLARMKVSYMGRNRAALLFQSLFSRYFKAKRALAELQRRRRLKVLRYAGAVALQRIGRGFIVRMKLLRIKSAKQALWFLQEWRARKNTKQALLNFRIRRRAAVKIQALARRFATRKFLIKNVKRLVKERNKRIRVRRQRAAVLLQGLCRMIAARRIVKRKRKELEKERKQHAFIEQLDESIESIHKDWMGDLLAIRAQSGTRGLLARQQFKKRQLTAAEEEEQSIKDRRNRAATKIQALARGVSGRKLYQRQLPILRRRKQARQFCVECEGKVATKRCRMCKDNYCDACFGLVHKKGSRLKHEWEPVRTATANTAVLEATDDEWNGNGNGNGAANGDPRGGAGRSRKGAATPAAVSTKANSRADWEQFYDANAKAKYWFNSKTGEASWTTPIFS